MKFLLGFITGVACSLILFWILEKTEPSKPLASEQTELTAEPKSDAISQLPPGFDTFYNQFHTDSAYQMEHIIFPLEGIPANVDSLTLASKKFRWQKNNWIMHRPFTSMEGAFERSFRNLGDEMVIENIQHESGRYGMERRFTKYDDGWYLIYYAGMNEKTGENGDR